MSKIGFIGLGKMGGSICENIIKGGYAVTCFDINKENLEKYEDSANIASTPSEVFLASDITFLSLPSSVQVEAVTNEFLNLNAKEKTVIDLSTSYPLSTREIYKKFESKGWQYGDASITGVPKQAEEGTLILLFGGNKETYNESLKIMETFSKKVHYMGDSGSGNVSKLVNNYLAIMYNILYAEIFPFAEKVGMDTSALYEVIGESGVDCRMYRSAGRKVVEKDYDLSFALELALKDLNYLKRLHEDLEAPSFVLDGGINLLRLGRNDGLGNGDITGVAQTVQELLEKK